MKPKTTGALHAYLSQNGARGGRKNSPAQQEARKAIAATMTPEARTARARKAALARWKEGK